MIVVRLQTAECFIVVVRF